MDIARAQQILQSENKIDVQHNGTNVWIESVDTNNGTAQVHPEGNKADGRTVQIDQLVEA